MSYTTTYSNLITTLSATAGDSAGLDARGRPPGQTLRIVGATALASVTGYNAGTANTGTSATSLANPAGGTNWTASALIGKWLRITSGGGASTDGSPVLRPILANTTTTLSVNTISGMDNTSVFQIVDLASTPTRISASDIIAIRAQANQGTVEIYGLDFSTTNTLNGLIELIDCADVKVSACKLSRSLANPALYAIRVQKLTVEHCRLTASSNIQVRRCGSVAITGCVNSAGGIIDIADCNFVDVTKLSAASSPSRVLSIVRATVATVEAACSTGSATPLYFEAVGNLSTVGGLLTGTGNTGYGIEIAFSGQYNLTGSTITGSTGDVLFDNNPATWALELGTTYGRVATQTMGAVAQTVPTKTLLYGNTLFNGSGDHSSRELFYGIINPAQNVGLVAAGTNAATALQLPAGEHYGIGTVAAGTGVKLHNVSALPGPRCVIDNNGANALLVYPTTGTINGAASYSIAAGTIKMLVCTDYSTDKWKVI